MYKMVLKEGKIIAVGMLMMLLLVVINSVYFFVAAEESVGLMSGNSIKSVVADFYNSSSVNHRIFILIQFFLVIFVIVAVLIVIKRFKSKSRLSKREFVKSGRVGSRTDLDILYEMLQKYKEVSIVDVGRIFDVAPDISLGWAKVLESGNLATIEYPRFGKPVLRLVAEGEGEEGEGEKEGNGEKEDKDKKTGLQKIAQEKAVVKKVVKEAKVRKIDVKKVKVKKISKRVAKKAEKKRISDINKELKTVNKRIKKVKKAKKKAKRAAKKKVKK